MQDVDVSTVSLFVCRRCTSSQFASYMKRAYRYKILVPMLLMCQLSAYLSAKDAPLDCSQLASYMKRVCMQKDMSTCPNAFDVSTVSLSVSQRCTFGLFPASYGPKAVGREKSALRVTNQPSLRETSWANGWSQQLALLDSWGSLSRPYAQEISPSWDHF